MENKRGQLTIFIIIAIIIVAAVLSYFAFGGYFQAERIPEEMEPIYNNLLSCLEQDTLTGIDLLETQAGYISLPNFEPGSSYMPFSSQLNFLGSPIPYWYYVSENNVDKEQVPTEKEMEEDLANFIEEKIGSCVFDAYYDQGFEIVQKDAEVSVDIVSSQVKINVDMPFTISKGEETVLIKKHSLNVDSALGELYDSARKIYKEEQENLFLENYGVDILRLYAPVDGVDLTCSPKIWIADEVFDDLQEAIEENTLALKTQGANDDYFVLDLPISTNARFISSKDWPTTLEVSPVEESILIAEPVGNQPGLGILGFCYVPYHFVYDVKYPVLVQVYKDNEIFQFPLAVIIQSNQPRKLMESSESLQETTSELCSYKNTILKVNTYDSNLNFVNADISYECFGTKCNIGQTSSGSLEAEFPQCVNGYILARAEGFETARYMYSIIDSGSVSIIMDKLYEMDVELKLDGVSYTKEAIINFISDDVSKTIVYPEQKTVELSEGDYEIQVSIYEDSSLSLEAVTTEQCVEVPQSGLGSLIGLTQEKCFDIEIPEQILSNALSGGGSKDYYILESELKTKNIIELSATSLPEPTTLEQLQDNYLLFESKDLGVNIK